MNNIETLKLALDALGPTPPECCECAAEWEIAITSIRQAIEQAEQVEPALDCTKVVCMGNNGCVGTCWNKDTSPSPRQPMTDEELKKIWYDMKNIMGWYSFQEIARAIEAKLKEKNT